MTNQADHSTGISTDNSTDTSASAAGSEAAEAAAAAAAQNQTMMPETCLVPGGIAITIQNSSSWEDTGCLLGFYCKWHYSGSG
jgi:hypothetical protein